MFDIFNTVYTYFAHPWGLVELFGVIANLVCVILAARHNQWTWFFGVIGVILFGAMFYNIQLYSDVILQLVFFLPLQFWGFYEWRKMAQQTQADDTVLSLGFVEWCLTVCVIALASYIWGDFMDKNTEAAMPFSDAYILCASVAAQILMNRKFSQAWSLWIAVDVIAIHVYWSKGLVVTSGLYVVFLGIAIMGGYKWHHQWKAQNPRAVTA